MTTQILEAVFQDGTFRPVRPASISLTEGQHVRLVVEVDTMPDVLALAGDVYEGLSAEELSEVEQIALDRRDFFGRTS